MDEAVKQALHVADTRHAGVGALGVLAAEVRRLHDIEQASRDYVDAVDRGREMDIPNLGKPVLQFQRMRAALGGYPSLADPEPLVPVTFSSAI